MGNGKGKRPAPLFGAGLLFGNPGPAASTSFAPGSSVPTQNGGSFFTPVNLRSSSSSESSFGQQANGKGVQGRAPPAQKRIRDQVDVDDSIPSFQLHAHKAPNNGTHPAYQQQRQSSHPSLSASSSASLTGEFDSDMLADDDGYEQKNGILEASLAEGDDDQSSLLQQPPQHHHQQQQQQAQQRTAASRRSSSHAHATRRSTRINNGFHPNGQPNPNVQDSATVLPAARKAALVKSSRIPSNSSRERKRSKAGPSNFGDDSNSHSTAENAPYLTSSSPPSATTSTFDLPPSSAPPPPPTSSVGSSAPLTNGRHPSTNVQQQARSSSQTREQQYRLEVEAQRKALAENWLRSIFSGFAHAAYAMSRYDCAGAVRAVLELPSEQQRCQRALLMLARAHFESLEYPKVSHGVFLVRVSMLSFLVCRRTKPSPLYEPWSHMLLRAWSSIPPFSGTSINPLNCPT